MFSARAINYPNPMPCLKCGEHTIKWTSSFKYLGYWLTTKLGWGNVIGKMKLRIRQQTGLVNSIKFGGASSSVLRRILFSTFVLPFFTWLFALHPLFTDIQRSNLNHFYYTSLKRVYHCLQWEDFFFASAFGERPLDDLCYAYWEKYCKALSNSIDGFLLLEQSSINAFRSDWERQEYRINCLRKSKRFVPHMDVLGLATRWMSQHGTANSLVPIDPDELRCFAEFPGSF